ncbi:rhomboid family intramembrane serine protease [Desulfuromonas carbonis]|uniref:rhomboid family intramembrane serine protease n=1 Tax=Desulfuromonas sp. DDH964 TaxID=1823759 RepID=UPI00078B34AE|nr:rhomboid family intramembrane serine protease [Desulfuromonas sp. DDH964]AMV73029.1 rhomboid-like membrane protein [Desulfuromonas sp. DDH964]
MPPTSPETIREEPLQALPPQADLPDGAQKALRVCALVLEARGIPFQVVSGEGAGHLEVPASFHARACRELALYRDENRDWPPLLVSPASVPAPTGYATLSILALLALFHVLVHGGFTSLGLSSANWLAAGAANSALILAGDWWRPLTALTLHADNLHLLGNLLLGAPLVLRLCRELGSGTGWALVLASGALGNLSNCLFQAPSHISIGASTALFGGLGLLAGLALVRGRRARLRDRVLPVAAALGLLALLGTGDGNTDILAHLGGFFWGMILGLPAGMGREQGAPGARFDWLLGGVSAALLGGAWWAALRLA